VLASGTLSIPAGTTVTDLLQVMSNINGAPWLPAHAVKIQNNGTGTIRIAEVTAVQGSLGIKVGPGEAFEMQLSPGDRLGIIGDGGAAAPNIDVLLWAV
jgi:hypothetical protein